MNLKEAREHYYFHTGKVSDIVRQLALGGIAAVWLFHSGDGSSVVLPVSLLLSLKLIVLGLALDLLQYASGSAIWGFFQWHRERRGTSESEEFKVPHAINWPALAFFWAKVLAVAVAYWQLLGYLASVLSAGV